MGFEFSEHGRPVIDREKCTACGLCVKICSTETLAERDGRIAVTDGGSFMGCIGCGHCMMVCPTGAVRVTGRRVDASDLADLRPAGECATADQLDGLLLSRRSIRRFTDAEVDRATVDRIIAMTSTAPMGIPPSDIGLIVFHGRDKVRQFTADAIDCFKRVRGMFSPLMLTLMRPFMKRADYRAIRDFVRPLLDTLVEWWSRGQDCFAYNAPLAILFHRGPMADVADVHIAATYAMLAGQSLGLGSCMIGTTQALDHDKLFRAKHGLPRDNKFGLAVVFGYPAATFQRGLRRQFESVRFA
ncbi:MAG: nitroreductase family protein [Phycisphaerae bacterium]|nr:nitroreductase family protein [Phycisphaerae bacterium]